MKQNTIEHINMKVKDPQATSDLLCRIFDWHIRWQSDDPTSDCIHVGNDSSYVSLWSDQSTTSKANNSSFNHMGVVVEDLEAVRDSVTNEGLAITDGREYSPGSRFYFFDPNGIEYEVVSYS